jgi:hypothetical protein
MPSTNRSKEGGILMHMLVLFYRARKRAQQTIYIYGKLDE